MMNDPTTNHQPPTTSPQPHLTPAQVARRLGVGVSKVLHWIRRGQLQALDVAVEPGPGKRHRWKISMEALASFEAQRATGQLAIRTASTSKSRKPLRSVENFL